MKRRGFLALSAVALTGCVGTMRSVGGNAILSEVISRTGSLVSSAGSNAPSTGSMNDLQDKSRLMQEVMNNPDLPAWHEQREKMALALGDRIFNRSVDRVFDSMTAALATMGARVQSMERTSGYIAGSIPDLGPVKTNALQKEALRQYAVAKGYKASIAESSNSGFDIDVGGTANMMARGMGGLTISMMRQTKTQTKVKLRFDNIHYPVLVSEYYKTVWAAVDKQMFLDQSLD